MFGSITPLLRSDAARIENHLTGLCAEDQSLRFAAERQEPGMDTKSTLHRMTAQEIDALMKDATSRAHALRQEAIDDLWSHLSARVQRLWTVVRSASDAPRHQREADK